MKKTLCYFLLLALLAINDNQAFGQYVWTKDARNPILSGSGNETWNKHLFQPSVLFNADSAQFEMWFGAAAGPETPTWRPYHIGFAVSDDGINWTIYPTPVLSPDPSTWDEFTVEQPRVIRENGQYKMWYTSLKNDFTYKWIGYATSPDGINWTKYPDNPVLGLGTSAWEDAGPYSCSVMPVTGGYKMWYAACAYPSQISNIGYATSVDGIVWQRDTLNNPVLTIGTTGQWDDYWLLEPQVLYIDSTYYMWYLGSKTPDIRQVGLATSPDGIVWTKYAVNPVLALSPGKWDADDVENGTVLLIGDTLHIWYTGSRAPESTYLWRIGHATSPFEPIDIIEAEQGIAPKHFNLEQNYPNPFNPLTTIEFDISTSGFVSLKVYNVTGQEVATLVNKELSSGTYKIEWRPENLSSGLYFYKLETKGYQETKKLVLMK
jgi:predicted GH43/DUF377 family glycosyl hydrolase